MATPPVISSATRLASEIDGNGRGGDVVSVEGTARIDPDAPPSTGVAAYQERYRDWIARNGWTPESFAADYPVAIRITPTRVLFHE